MLRKFALIMVFEVSVTLVVERRLQWSEKNRLLRKFLLRPISLFGSIQFQFIDEKSTTNLGKVVVILETPLEHMSMFGRLRVFRLERGDAPKSRWRWCSPWASLALVCFFVDALRMNVMAFSQLPTKSRKAFSCSSLGVQWKLMFLMGLATIEITNEKRGSHRLWCCESLYWCKNNLDMRKI